MRGCGGQGGVCNSSQVQSIRDVIINDNISVFTPVLELYSICESVAKVLP